MSAEIDYLLIFIWEDSGVVESQTMLLCYEVEPYQKNLWLHKQDKRGISEKHTDRLCECESWLEDDASQHMP